MISFDDPVPAPTRDRERTERLLGELTAASAVSLRPDATAVLEDDDFLVADETLDVPPAESPLRRYLKYHVLDFVKQRGVWLLALGLLGVYFLWDNYVPGPATRVLPRGIVIYEAERFRGMIETAGALFAALATVFSVHGIVSVERERGLQRFLFAKPVARLPYYAQKLAVAFAGTLAVTALVTMVAGLGFVRAVPLDTVLTLAVALFACVGGLTFFLSTLVRFEGGLAIALTAALFPLRELATEPRWQWLATLRYLLPPIDRLGGIVDQAGGDPVRAMLWAFAYGAVYTAAGFAILRRRSILS